MILTARKREDFVLTRHQYLKMKKHQYSAFSLIELVIVISIIAVISAVIIPSISGTREAARLQNAISAAGTLNLAQAQWRLEKSPTDWGTGKTDSQRFGLVKDYMEFVGSDDWTAFTARYSPYTFKFQDMTASGKMQKVQIFKSGDTTPIPY